MSTQDNPHISTADKQNASPARFRLGLAGLILVFALCVSALYWTFNPAGAASGNDRFGAPEAETGTPGPTDSGAPLSLNSLTWVGEQIDEIAGDTIRNLQIADIDDDGQGEIVVATGNGLLLSYNLQAGAWVSQTVAANSGLAWVRDIGDADNDGKDEILADWSNYGALWLYKFDGGIWNPTVMISNRGWYYTAAIGDADGDSANEIVVGDYGIGQLLLFKYNGETFVQSQIDTVSDVVA